MRQIPKANEPKEDLTATQLQQRSVKLRGLRCLGRASLGAGAEAKPVRKLWGVRCFQILEKFYNG